MKGPATKCDLIKGSDNTKAGKLEAGPATKLGSTEW